MDLRRLLRLIGRGLGAESAYVLLAPPKDGSMSNGRAVDQWRRVAWHTNGRHDDLRHDDLRHDEVRHDDVDVTDPPAEHAADKEDNHSAAPAAVSDAASQIVVALHDSAGDVVGYLGIRYRGDEHVGAEAPTFRLVHEIVADFLRRSGISTSFWEDDRHWQAVVNGFSDAALVLVEDRVAHCNYAGAQLLGGPHSDSVIGRSLQDFVSAQDWDILLDHFNALSAGSAVSPITCQLIRLDGHEHLIEAHCKPIVCQGSPAFRIILRKIRQGSRYSERLIDTLSEGVWQIELEKPVSVADSVAQQVRQIRRMGSLVECNRNFAAYFGSEHPNELIGRKLAAFLIPFGFSIVEAFVESGYDMHGFESCVRGEDGKIRCFVVNATGSVDQGCLTHVWGSCTEITDLVELERMSVTLQEEQQERIGRDLHDCVAPLLTGLRLLSDDLVTENMDDSRTLQAKARKIASFAEEATRQLRTIYKGLVPRELEDDSLSCSLETLAAMADLIPGTVVTFAGDEHLDGIDRQIKIQLYRIAQEAVNNSLKHAGASLVRMRLSRNASRQIVLEIADDGVGYDTSSVLRGSLGLENMKLRAHSIGASLTVVSEPGAGTSIRCMLTCP